MKKIFLVLTALLAFSFTGVFAEDVSAADESSGKKNLFIFEATAGAIGFGINEVVTYNYKFNDFFGIGGGIAVSEGMIGTIDGFVDFKLAKWNLGLGTGYNYAYNSQSWIFRGVYHGNSWNWGPLKAGMTLGADWHLYSASGDGKAEMILAAMGMIPRFVIGIDAQLGF